MYQQKMKYFDLLIIRKKEKVIWMEITHVYYCAGLIPGHQNAEVAVLSFLRSI